MSQRYIILKNTTDNNEPATVFITNAVVDQNSKFVVWHNPPLKVVSSGSVSFTTDTLGHAHVNVTHGNIALGIEVNLAQMEEDKVLLQKLFCN